MFPSVRHRILLILCLVIAVWLCNGLADAIGAGNGHGSSLLFTGSIASALLSWALYLAPVLLLAVVCGAAGNPLTGYGLIAAALMVYAFRGGSINAWLYAVDSPAAYHLLALEAAVWTAPFIAYTLIERYLRQPLRARLPRACRSHYCVELPATEPAIEQSTLITAGINMVIAAALVFILRRDDPNTATAFLTITVTGIALMLVIWAISLAVETVIEHTEKHRRLRAPMAPAFLAGLITLVIGSAGTFLLQVNHDNGQVIGALLVSFTIGGFLGHQTFPTPSRLTILLSPLALAAAGYLYTAFAFDDATQMVMTSFSPTGEGLPAIALAMPAHYAAAGIFGAALGAGWSQVVYLGREKHVALAT